LVLDWRADEFDYLEMSMSQALNTNYVMCLKRGKRKNPSTPYSLSAAGGTLVFPDRFFLIPQAKAHGYELHLHLRDAVHIGDIFNVDVRGANAAGIRRIHLDPLGRYSGWPGGHLPDIRALPDWLSRYSHSPAYFDLFPFGGQIPRSSLIEEDSASLCPVLGATPLATQTLHKIFA
jgi:hypothetical protein